MIDVAAVATALREALETSTSLPHGLGERPRDEDGAELPFPIGILILEPGTDWNGPPMGADHDDAVFAWQLDYVGQTYEQVLLAVGRGRAAIADRHPDSGAYVVPLTVAGVDVQIRELADDSGVEPAAGLFQISQRFTTHCFPKES